MKANLVLSKLATLLGLESNDALKKALETASLAELELGDDIEKEMNAKLLTRESAKHDAEVTGAIVKQTRSETFDKVDRLLKPYLEMVAPEDSEAIGKTFETYKKIELLQPALKKALEKAQAAGATDDVKALKDKISKIEGEWADKLKKVQDDSAAALQAKEVELKNKNLDFHLKNKIFARTFAKEYANDKEQIAELKIAKLKKENILSLADDGSILVQYDDNGTVRDKFDANQKRVTIESLLDADLATFTKKSNGKDDDDQGGKSKSSFKETDRADQTSNLAQLRKQGRTTSVS